MSATYSDLPYTKFPDEQDDLIVYTNINENNKSIVDEYLLKLNNGQFDAANTYYQQHKTVLDKAIINEHTINNLLQSIIAVERIFANDIAGYINSVTIDPNRRLVPIELVDVLPTTTEVGKLYLVLETPNS